MLSRIYLRSKMLAGTRHRLTLLAGSLCLLSALVCASHVAYSSPVGSTLFIGNTSVAEGDGAGTVNLNFTVTLFPADNIQTVTVDFRTSTTAENINTFGPAGAATASPDAGADYGSRSGTLIFNPGETSKSISITVNSDCLPENDEGLRVLLSNATNANLSNDTAQGQITTDDQRSLSINNTSIFEGDSGTTLLTFTVSLIGSPVTAQSVAACGPVTVGFRTSTTTENINTFGPAGAATASPDAGADYVSQSGTLTFNPGETSKPISITVNPDCLPENDEALRVLLSNATNANILNDIAQGQISTDDNRSLSINNASVVEGDSGTTLLTFTVSLSGSPITAQSVAACGPLTVDFRTSTTAENINTFGPAGAATASPDAGADYVSQSGTLTFNPGETSKPISITVNPDCLPENNETLLVFLSNITNASLTNSSGQGTIQNSSNSCLQVTNTSDSGDGSLRQALESANTNIDANVINFAIPGAGPFTITPATPLPALVFPIVIDGYTQPGSALNADAAGSNAVLLIELNGSAAGPGANGLVVSGSNSVVRGLVINRFTQNGLSLSGNNNLIEGNFIGTDSTGALNRGNGQHGIFVTSSNSTIGGTTTSSRNVISFNGGDGISVANGTANRIRGNNIFNNGGLGIDLSPDGVTPDDTNDPDTGPNNLQNFPMVTSIARFPGSHRLVNGTLNSAPNQSYALDFFNSPSCDASGNGQGQSYLGSTMATTDGSGNASFSISLPLTPPGAAVTTTATDPTGNTSEFSSCQNTPTAAPANISGQITTADGNPLGGVVLVLSGGDFLRRNITNNNGFYQFTDVETNAFYTVTPSRANYSFSPSSRNFSLLANMTEAAFTALPTGGNANALDTTEFFVRQHYLDFLGREPDQAGLNFWTNNIESCGVSPTCRAEKRIDTSAAFFLSIEFQQTGFLVERIHQSAFNRFPNYRDFVGETHEIGRDVIVGQGTWQARLDANKQQFTTNFVAQPAFVAVYGGLSSEQYVDALNANTGSSLSASDRNELVGGLNNATETRASVLRKVAENAVFTQRELNRAFVLMQYFGYLRRNPSDAPDADFSGYNFWLAKLNSFGGDFRQAEMVKGFIVSSEYRQRFGW